MYLSLVAGAPRVALGVDAPAVEAVNEDDEVAKKRQEQAETRRKAMEFVSSDGMLDEFYIMYKSLEAERELMNQFLHGSSIAWKMEQAALFAATGQRSYQALNILSMDCYWRVYFDAALSLLQDDAVWKHLNFTFRNSTNILRYGAHAAAVLYELAVLPARRYPWRLFKLLDPMEDKRSLAEELFKPGAACLHDTFTSEFIKQFPSVEEVCSEHAQLSLRMIADRLEANTHSTERLHSVNLRQARKRETHVTDLAWLSLRHLKFGGTSWLAPSSSDVLSKCLGPTSSPPSLSAVPVRENLDVSDRGAYAGHSQASAWIIDENSDDEPHDNVAQMEARSEPVILGAVGRPSAACIQPSAPTKKKRGRKPKAPCTELESGAPKKKRGVGGAWRSYCHIHSTSAQFTPSRLKELAQGYKALTAQEKSQYLQLGTNATRAHRLGLSSFSRRPAATSTSASGSTVPATTQPGNPSQTSQLAQTLPTATLLSQSSSTTAVRSDHAGSAIPHAQETAEAFLRRCKLQASHLRRQARSKVAHTKAKGQEIEDRLARFSKLSSTPTQRYFKDTEAAATINVPFACPAIAFTLTPLCLSASLQEEALNLQQLHQQWLKRHAGIVGPAAASIPRPLPSMCHTLWFVPLQGQRALDKKANVQ